MRPQENCSRSFFAAKSWGSFPDPQHEGHDGWQADGILYGLQIWLTTHQPDVVLLHIGTNDITKGNQDANEVNSILNVIDDYENANNKHVTVILALIINRRIYSPATTEFNDDVNDMAMNRIANGDDIIIADMESALNYDIGVDMADEVHPNDNGYAKMAAVWVSFAGWSNAHCRGCINSDGCGFAMNAERISMKLCSRLVVLLSVITHYKISFVRGS